ncbi:site-specific DNA-methyltransferase (plasmid) [Haladaptatus sp. SPP-AMP-3]|uniref:site-specific DNA-methyltransferase n=1 Tax=Haladaptatus sp. SPP-AMP-3 TaxID=3121295 RepID=UPI003C2E8CDC
MKEVPDEEGRGSLEKLEKEESVTDILDQIRQLVPSAFSEGELDPTKLAQILGQKELPGDRYEFRWAGKQGALDEARRAPKQTLKPDYERSLQYNDTENILIEGENLEAMKTLQKAYHRRVKMVYIDPPYNTGNDFIYNDNYYTSRAEYERETGQRDEDGNRMVPNPKTNGRYHSNWLSMMYPRLFMARSLLRDDGAIFVSIDYNEYHNLRMLMNEIFGEDNYVATLVWKRRNPDARNSGGVSFDHEYVVVYQKSNEFEMKGEKKTFDAYDNPDDDPRGPWQSVILTNPKGKKERPNLHYPITDPETGNEFLGTWKYKKDTMQTLIDEGRILFPDSPDGVPRRKLFKNEISDTLPLSSLIEPTNTDMDIESVKESMGRTILQTGLTSRGTKEIKDLFGFKAYDHPKSVGLVRKLVDHTVDPGDIVLDFFAGSGTTGHAVMEHNAREQHDEPVKFVLVQLDEKLDEPRKGFEILSEICRTRIKLAADHIAETESDVFDSGLKVFQLSKSNFRRWQPTVGAEETKAAVQSAIDDDWVGVEDEDAALIEVLLTEGFTPNADIEQVDDDDPDKWMHVAEDGREVYISFNTDLTFDTIDGLSLSADTPLICLDAALSDTQKDNAARKYTLKTV